MAADGSGNLFFVTGNSDTPYAAGAVYSDTYDPPNNIQESVVKLSPDLTTVMDVFTPSDKTVLDQKDWEIGAGGVMLLPDQPGSVPRLATVAGKVGPMYLLNRDQLGGYAKKGKKNVVDSRIIGRCFCGQSYFEAADGVSRVVSSGGDNAIVWRLQTSPTTMLVKQSSTEPVPTAQRGFFTTISSNSHSPGTAIIWAVSRPTSAASPEIALYAFSADDAKTIYTGKAGTWPNVSGNPNIVPVVANGKVFVASFKELAIFGMGGHERVAPQQSVVERIAPSRSDHERQVTGIVVRLIGSRITVRTKSGKLVRVDAAEAQKQRQSVVVHTGKPIKVLGNTEGTAIKAHSILRAHESQALWDPDR